MEQKIYDVNETRNYKRVYEENYKNIKTRFFLDFFDQRVKTNGFSNVYSTIDDKDILKSLSAYISKRKIGYQITARNYMTYVNLIFLKLSNEYGIKNPYAIDKEKNNLLMLNAEKIILDLKVSELKEIASDYEVELMRNIVNAKKGRLDLSDVDKEMAGNQIGESYAFKFLVSIIAISLVLDYGIKNSALLGLKEEHYRPKDNMLTVNGITIKLKDEYLDLFGKYLTLRTNVLNYHNKDEQYLFIKSNGDRIKSKEYKCLFWLSNKEVGSVAMEKYSYNAILKMISNNVDIATIIKLTAFSSKLVIRVQEYYNEEVIHLNADEYFSNQKERENPVEDKYIVCPVCGRKTGIKVREWLAVKYGEHNDAILSCRYCGGVKNDVSL